MASEHVARASASADPMAALVLELHPALKDSEIPYEAERCLFCGSETAKAPCTVACPAGIDVPGFIQSLAHGEADRAAALIFAENPLGGSCARVCPTEVLCEAACVLEREGRRPVSIARLQRAATDLALRNPETSVPVHLPHNGLRVAVVGAGPAGMACAATLAPLGYAVTIYDNRPEVGGLVRYAIAPYRQVREPLPQEADRLRQMGVRFQLSTPVETAEGLSLLEREFDAVFLGIGLGEDADVHYPGDDLPGVYESLPFIEALKEGRPLPVGRRVAVVGGGNTAMDVARETLRLGAEEVAVLYRRTEAEMPAFRHEVLEAMEDGVRFLWLTLPVELHGLAHLESVRCVRMELGEADESGRRRPEVVPGSAFDLPVDTLVRAVGQQYRKGFLQLVEGIGNPDARIAVDTESGQTANPKFFAGGDAVNGGGTVVDAVRHGKTAAFGIDRYLRRHSSPQGGRGQ
ncbi:MAG: NAD(P)-dependent oxidoreductase [Thermaerobacter sp.]|nr:NAD(P)-dependent oxidoreductase [Thermaerobacter sp.]